MKLRLVHYQPDPFTGNRYLIGALLEDSRGNTRPLPAAHLPNHSCLPSRAHGALVEALAEQLLQIRKTRDLFHILGPAICLADGLDVPADVDDVDAWSRLIMDPFSNRGDKRTSPQVQRAEAVGMQFFRTFGMEGFVKSRFKPRESLGGLLQPWDVALKPITHWAGSKHSVVLLEPLIVNERTWRNSFSSVATRLLAYQAPLHQAEVPATMGIYVLHGGRPELRRSIIEDAPRWAIKMYDCTSEESRVSLGEVVRMAAKHASAQPPLFEQ